MTNADERWTALQARHKTTKATTIRAGTSFGIRSRGQGRSLSRRPDISWIPRPGRPGA